MKSGTRTELRISYGKSASVAYMAEWAGRPRCPNCPIGAQMFVMWIKGESTGNVPTFPVRLERLVYTVACELDALGYVVPNETPMSVMYEVVDMAVARHFPDMDQFGGNDRYVRKMVRCVGKRAFARLDAQYA